VLWLGHSVSSLTQDALVERGAARSVMQVRRTLGGRETRGLRPRCMRSNLSILGGKRLMVMGGFAGGRWLFEPGGFALDFNRKSKQSNRDSIGPC
jgi:hypothetical protein